MRFKARMPAQKHRPCSTLPGRVGLSLRTLVYVPQLCIAAVFWQQSPFRIRDVQPENAHIHLCLRPGGQRCSRNAGRKAMLPGCGERRGLPAGLRARQQMGVYATHCLIQYLIILWTPVFCCHQRASIFVEGLSGNATWRKYACSPMAPLRQSRRGVGPCYTSSCVARTTALASNSLWKRKTGTLKI